MLVLLPGYLYVIYQFRQSSQDIEFNTLVLFVLRTSQLATDYQLFVSTQSAFQLSIISIERCKKFEEIEPEKQYLSIEKDRKKYELPNRVDKFDASDKEGWGNRIIFTNGFIQLFNITAKYPSRPKPVLNNITTEIKAGEKVGIVGRTGAGKSSFIKLFPRILVPDEGKILIDGVDIAGLDLKHLRNEILVLSQNTSIFEGTLRENIDPYLKDPVQERALVELLEDLGMDSQELKSKGLDMKIEQDWCNLSQGERQKIALVRAGHHKRKIVIFDEATSSMDMKTEEKFQAKVMELFKDCTMLVIAHRLQTVMSCDKIMVFDEGRIIEYDTPSRLREDPLTVFSQLCNNVDLTG